MADRKNIINYAAWRRNQKKQKSSGSDQNQKSKNKLRRIVILAVPALLLLWFIILVVIAVGSGNVSGFFHFFSNSLVTFIAACITVPGTIIGAIRAASGKQITTVKFVWALCACYVCLGGILTACTTELVALIGENKSKEEPADLQEAQTKPAEDVEKVTVYEKKRYSFKDDLFIEEVEAYYGIERGVTDDEALKMRADLILEDIEKEKKIRVKRDVPKSFWDNWEIADNLYDTYKFQLKMADKVERKSILPDLKSYRLENLQAAKKHRKLADEQYEDPENQRLLVLYCIDLCDEYLKDGDIHFAQAELIEGAEWAVKSMYNAAVEDKKEKVEEGYWVLEDVMDRLEKMSGEISGETIENIRNCKEAYEIVLQKIK